MSRFIVPWIAVAEVSILGSVVLAVCSAFLSKGASADPVVIVQIAAVLSFSALSGIGQGWLLRRQLQRPILWGVSSGTGIIVAAAIIAEIAGAPEQLWWPIVWRLAFWIRKSFDLSVTPWTFTGYVLSGLTFGLILGAAQASTLRFGWRAGLRWIGISVLSGVLTSILLYSSREIDSVTNALDWLAASIPMPSGPRGLLFGTSVLLLLGVSFALPTGAFMQHLLRSRLQADVGVVLQRFD
jgi:hypothetical protein